MNLYEKHLEAINQLSILKTFAIVAAGVAVSETYAKEEMEAFDVWKYENRWIISLIDKDEYVYHKLGETFKTFAQLYNLFKNRK